MRTRHVVLLLLISLGAVLSRKAPAQSPCDALISSAGAAPRVVYLKGEHQLCLFARDGSVKRWRASHGRRAGKKQFEGDARTPEGRYMLRPARTSARFGLFMSISYPSADDLRFASAAGRRAGGDIGIHGPQRWYAFLGGAQSLVDHSDGCIVMDAKGIEELASLVKQALPIDIVPDE